MSNEKLTEALQKIVEWAPPLMKDRDGNESSMALEIGTNGVRDYFRAIAREALQAHDAEATQPQAQNSEWVMVPREPTQAMLDANGDCDFPEGKAWLEKDARTTWAAMLAAAPQPQAAEPVYQVREYEDDFWVWVDADAHRYSTADPKRRRVLYTHPQAALAEPVEAIGCLSIRRFRGCDSMVNHDFDYFGSLPDGDYRLYTHPQPAQDAKESGR